MLHSNGAALYLRVAVNSRLVRRQLVAYGNFFAKIYLGTCVNVYRTFAVFVTEIVRGTHNASSSNQLSHIYVRHTFNVKITIDRRNILSQSNIIQLGMCVSKTVYQTTWKRPKSTPVGQKLMKGYKVNFSSRVVRASVGKFSKVHHLIEIGSWQRVPPR